MQSWQRRVATWLRNGTPFLRLSSRVSARSHNKPRTYAAFQPLESRTLLTATHLAFITQPANCTADTGPGAVTVYAEDASNNIATDYNGTGYVDFAQNQVNQVGSGPAITFSNGIGQYPAWGNGPTVAGTCTMDITTATMPVAVSQPFVVSPGVPKTLAFPQSTGMIYPLLPFIKAGAATSSPIIVTLSDAYGNIESSPNTVTLSIGSDPSGATLSGTKSITASNGTYDFSNLTFSTAGSYVLVGTSGNITSSIDIEVGVSNTSILCFNGNNLGGTYSSAVLPATAAGVPLSIPNVNLMTNGIGGAPPASTVLTILSGPDASLAGQQVGTRTFIPGWVSFSNVTFTKAGSYTLQVSDGNDIPNVLHVQVNPSTNATWTVVSQPTTGSPGVPLSPNFVVEAVDIYGNLLPGATVRTTIASGPVGGTMMGGTGATFASQITLSPITVSSPGLYTFLVQNVEPGNASTPAVTAPVLIGSPASPRQLVFLTPPSNIVANKTFTPAIRVAVEDQNGNIVTSDNTVITLSTVSKAPSFTGPTSVQAINGIATFSNLTNTHTGTYTLQATSTADGILTTALPFTVSPGMPASLEVTWPTSAKAGIPLSPIVVGLYDGFGNIITPSSDTLTLVVASGPGTLSGNTTIPVVNGMATFSNVSLSKAGTYRLRIGYNGTVYAVTASANLTVSAGAPSQLVFLQNSTGGIAGGVLNPVSVAIEDAAGDICTGLNSNINISLANTSASLSGATTVSAQNGIATFSNLSITAADSFNLTARDATDNLATAGVAIATVQPGKAAKFLILQQPTTGVAGAILAPTLKVEVTDAFGNPVMDGSNVTLSVLSGPGQIFGNTTQPNPAGLWNFNVYFPVSFSNLSLNKTGTYQLQLADAIDGLSATLANLTISPAAAAKLVFSQPATTAVGVPTSIAVTIEDAFGNAVVSDNTTVTLARTLGSGSYSGPLSVQAVNGVATFSNLTFSAAGQDVFNAMDVNDSFSADSPVLIVNTTTPTHLVFNNFPATLPVNQDFPLGPTIAVEDAAGAIVTSDSALLFVTLSGPGHPAIQYTFPIRDGVSSLTRLSFPSAGVYTIAVSDRLDNLSASANITVLGPTAKMVFLQQPGEITAGTPFSVTVAIEDATGDILTTDNSPVSLSANIGNALLGNTTVNAVNGVATFSNLSIIAAGNYLLGASDTQAGLSAVSLSPTPITVAPAAPAQLSLLPVSSPLTAGQPFNLAVVPQDAFGNPVPGAGGAVVSVASGPGVIAGPTRADFSGGIATFSNVSLAAPGTYVLSFFDATHNLSVNSVPLTVASGPAAKLAFLQQPGNIVAGEPFSIAVQVLGAGGYAADAMITLALPFAPAGAVLSGLTSVQSINGVATFTNLRVSKSGSYFFQASAGPGVSVVSNQCFAAQPPTHVQIVKQPGGTIAAGKPLPAITVQLLDSANNIVSAESSNVTLSLVGKGALAGATRIPVTRGAASFAGLTFITPGTYSFTISDGSMHTTTQSFTVTPDFASAHLHLQSPPKPAIVGKPLSTFRVDVEDKFGNIIKTDHSKVTLRIAAGPAGAAIAGAATLSFNNGVASFSNVSLTRGGNYTLQVVDTALPVKTPVRFSETIAPVATVLAAPAVAKNYVAGKAIVLTTTLKSALPQTIPFTGLVSLVNAAGTVVKSAKVAPTGVVTLTLTGLPLGASAFTLQYAGDNSHRAAVSARFALHVVAATSTAKHS